jgi:hypothetical protein
MAKRLADIIRNVAGAPVSGALVTVKRVIDNSTITSTTTGADGKAEFSEATIGYPGQLYYSATDGDTTRQHSGYSTGQIGTWFASDFPRAMRIMTDGVRSGVDGELNVTANGTNRTLTIANGLAFLYGHTYYQPANLTLDIAANGAGNPRIDLIVVRLYPPGTANEGKIELAIVQGSPSATPAAPTATQDPATVYEIPLKTVLVDSGVSALVSGKLTDVRVWTSGPLQDLSVTTAKLGNNVVTPAKLTSVTDFSTAAAAKVLKASTSPTITPAYGTLNLSELNDVDSTTPVDSYVLTWETATSTYKPKAPPAVQVTVQEGDVTVDAAVNTLDFDANNFNITSSPAGEANVALAFGTAANTPAAGNHTHLLAGITDVTATAAQLNFSTGVTSNIQTQLGTKADASTVTTSLATKFDKTGGSITGATTVTGALAVTAAANLGTLGNPTKLFGTFGVGGSAFTVTIGSAAGTGGSAAATRILGADNAGEVQIVTGTTGVTTGTILQVNFANAMPDTNYIVLLTPSSTNAGLINASVSTRSTGNFLIRANTAPGTGQTLMFGFLVVQVNP